MAQKVCSACLYYDDGMVAFVPRLIQYFLFRKHRNHGVNLKVFTDPRIPFLRRMKIFTFELISTSLSFYYLVSEYTFDCIGYFN
jgi:hypothetical protein